MNYQPHEYQQYATDFIIKNPTAAVFLEMGLGKSVIALTRHPGTVPWSGSRSAGYW